MSQFLSPLQVEELADNRHKLLVPLVYQSDVAGRTFTVPAGFVTDYASVPRVIFAYWIAGGTANEAAVVHDFLYQSHQTEKRLADRVFLEAALVTGNPRWRAYAMYQAVKWFSGTSYQTGPERMRSGYQ